MRLTGAFYLGIDQNGLTLFVHAEFSYGIGDAQIKYPEATGLLILSTGLGSEGGIPGIAGQLTVAKSKGVGIPDVGELLRIEGSTSITFNTTMTDWSFDIPVDFQPLMSPGSPTKITIAKSAPRLDGTIDPNAPGAVYLSVTIQAELNFGGVLTLSGFIKIDAELLPADADGDVVARLIVTGAVSGRHPLIGSLTGQLNLNVFVSSKPAKSGVVGRVFLALSNSNIPNVALTGTFLLELNSFAGPKSVFTFQTKTRELFADPNDNIPTLTVFDGFERNADNSLKVVEQTLSIEQGFKIVMGGHLVVGGLVQIDGEICVRLGQGNCGAPGQPRPPVESGYAFELVVNGTMSLSPIGSLNITDSGLLINSRGLVARLNVSITGGFGGGVGLSFTANAVIEINTTGQAATIGSTTVGTGFRLHIDGTIRILGTGGQGTLDVTIRDNLFQLEFALSFNLGGLVFQANGGAAVAAGPNPGFALRLNIRALADTVAFSIDAGGTLMVNTSSASLLGIAGNTFFLDIHGKVEILKVIKFDAGLRVTVTSGRWAANANASMDFFGLATLSGSIFLNSAGDFDIRLSGEMVIGSRSFGIVGSFYFQLTARTFAPGDPLNPNPNKLDPNPWYVFRLAGGASVELRAFGLTFGGIGVDFSFGAEGYGSTEIRLSITVSIDFGLFTVSKTAGFTLGYLQSAESRLPGRARHHDADPERRARVGQQHRRRPVPERRHARPVPQPRRVRGRQRLDHRRVRGLPDRADRQRRRRRDHQGHGRRPQPDVLQGRPDLRRLRRGQRHRQHPRQRQDPGLPLRRERRRRDPLRGNRRRQRARRRRRVRLHRGHRAGHRDDRRRRRVERRQGRRRARPRRRLHHPSGAARRRTTAAPATTRSWAVAARRHLRRRRQRRHHRPGRGHPRRRRELADRHPGHQPHRRRHDPHRRHEGSRPRWSAGAGRTGYCWRSRPATTRSRSASPPAARTTSPLS